MTTHTAPQPFSPMADVETSSAIYATRFEGRAGQWLLRAQNRIVVALVGEVLKRSTLHNASLLDVGGGHGQILSALKRSPYFSSLDYTILGSAPQCEERVKEFMSPRCRFALGSLTSLPFENRSFDIVTSFRFIPHCDEWRQHIAELCRVARCAVIVDYPTSQSINVITPILFGLKKRVEKSTRTYSLFTHTEIAEAFAAGGFHVQQRQSQFFFPMVLHRMLKSPLASSAVEAIPRLLGLTAIFGSPVIAEARPQEGSPTERG